MPLYGWLICNTLTYQRTQLKNDPHRRAAFKQTTTCHQSSITNWSTSLPTEESGLSGVNSAIWPDRCALCVSQGYFQKLVWFWIMWVRRHRVKWIVQVTPQDSRSGKGVGSAFECLCIFSLTLATVQHILSGGRGADSRDIHTLFWGAVAERSQPVFMRTII